MKKILIKADLKDTNLINFLLVLGGVVEKSPVSYQVFLDEEVIIRIYKDLPSFKTQCLIRSSYKNDLKFSRATINLDNLPILKVVEMLFNSTSEPLNDFQLQVSDGVDRQNGIVYAIYPTNEFNILLDKKGNYQSL